MPKLKARHAYGKSTSVRTALDNNVIDAYDILLLDSDSSPKIGWVSKDGQSVVVSGVRQVAAVTTLPDNPETGVIYIVDGCAYFWDGVDFVELANNAAVVQLEKAVGLKVDEDTVDAKIEAAIKNVTIDVIEF